MTRMGFDAARHLLARTGFGPKTEEIEALSGATHARAVDMVLSGVKRAPRTAPPEWVAAKPALLTKRKDLRRTEESERREMRKAIGRELRRRGFELKQWWHEEMRQTSTPLTERMTLFWHNHFTSSLTKTKSPVLMYRQNALLRSHALGNFRRMLHAVARDPAMLLYLDNHTNRVGAPNENFARELLELFTLGEGRTYTEQDIKEAGRAFTGWQVHRQTGEFRFVRHQHDHGLKVFLGKRGALGGEDIIDTVLELPRVAEYIVEKMWRALVSDTPDAGEVRRLARVFRSADYEIKPLMRALLNSDAFRDPAHRGVLIKSPVQLIVGTMRVFGVEVERPHRILRLCAQLGQSVFDPPNVKGWPGGTAWITSGTLLMRQQLLARLFRDPGNIPDLSRDGWRALHGAKTRPDPAALAMKTLLPMAPVFPLDAVSSDPFDVARHAVLDPAYQLT